MKATAEYELVPVITDEEGRTVKAVPLESGESGKPGEVQQKTASRGKFRKNVVCVLGVLTVLNILLVVILQVNVLGSPDLEIVNQGLQECAYHDNSDVLAKFVAGKSIELVREQPEVVQRGLEELAIPLTNIMTASAKSYVRDIMTKPYEVDFDASNVTTFFPKNLFAFLNDYLTSDFRPLFGALADAAKEFSVGLGQLTYRTTYLQYVTNIAEGISIYCRTIQLRVKPITLNVNVDGQSSVLGSFYAQLPEMVKTSADDKESWLQAASDCITLATRFDSRDFHIQYLKLVDQGYVPKELGAAAHTLPFDRVNGFCKVIFNAVLSANVKPLQ